MFIIYCGELNNWKVYFDLPLLLCRNNYNNLSTVSSTQATAQYQPEKSILRIRAVNNITKYILVLNPRCLLQRTSYIENTSIQQTSFSRSVLQCTHLSMMFVFILLKTMFYIFVFSFDLSYFLFQPVYGLSKDIKKTIQMACQCLQHFADFFINAHAFLQEKKTLWVYTSCY